MDVVLSSSNITAECESGLSNMSFKLDLRPYQIEGKDFLLEYKRVVLGDDRGIGKTVEAVAAYDELLPDHTLIVTSKNGLRAWQKNFPKCMDDPPEVNIIRGTALERAKKWNQCKNHRVSACTFAVWMRDVHMAPLSWDLVIIDEAHKARNRKTKIHPALKKLQTPYLWLLTGTPANRGPQDLWGFLNLCRPRFYSSYWRFVNKYCIVIDGVFGKEIFGAQNTKALRQELHHILLRRKKSEVLPDLPPKTRQELPIEMTDEQRGLYDVLSEEMMAELPSDDLLLTPNVLAKTMRLRQLLVCPKLLNAELGYGAAIEEIADKLDGREDQHIVIFTPFAQALPLFKEYLTKRKFGPIFFLQGGMEPEQVAEVEEQFVSTQGIVIATIQFSQSFDLDSASYGYFIGVEWNPDDNYQAEDRMHRFTTTRALNIYYLTHQSTVEERSFEILNEKQGTVNRIFNTTAELREALQG